MAMFSRFLLIALSAATLLAGDIRLHGSLVGESEQRLTAALDAIEAMAPVVLWIDEIEKAVGGAGDQDGGAQDGRGRLLELLLRRC